MPETICKTNEPQDAVKTESSSSPESAACTWGFTALKSPQQSSESKPSPIQDEQELIDITTVKTEDSADTKTDANTDTKTGVDHTKKIDVCSSGKTDDGGEMVTSSPFDSGKTQSTQQMETNGVAGNQETIHTNSTTNFEEIQNQLKKTLDHIEQRHMVSGFRTLSNATNAVVEHCEQLGKCLVFLHNLFLQSQPFDFS